MTRLSSHFRSKADEGRVARVWSALEPRLARSARRRPLSRALLAFAACAAAVALGVWGLTLNGAQRAAPQVIELADGSRVEHGGSDQLEIAAVTPERVEVRMTRGSARFRVARNPKRVFLTHAGAYTIRVIGTEYAVHLGEAGVHVEVTRGQVEVRRRDGSDVWGVRAGESWSSTRVATRAPAPRTPEPVGHAQPSPREAAASSPAAAREPAAKPGVPLKPAAASHVLLARGSTRDDVLLARGSARFDAPLELFQRAQEARIAGRREETARLLDEFVRRFPDDPRTGLAAFELGRLRLEAGDARAALEALDRAESAGAALGEQVEARRVQALEQLGDPEHCRAARAAFLARFPGGTFAEVVRRRCP